ncbi:MAG: Peptide chain release factor 2 [Bacteriovoracaceae bacterium]|nr:Peptide chain release factor 2 [Bacteriovoracaceae bacterium]
MDPFYKLVAGLEESKEIVEISDAGDPILNEAASKIPELKRILRSLELKKMLSGESDRLGAIISINAGSGGTEAQDWAQMIQRMMLRYANRKGFAVELVDEQAGEGAGIKSCAFICRGEFAYGYFKSERGVHRLVRISPFDANKKRHTSFAAVDVVPEADETIEIEIRPDDLKVDTFRAGGAGGQHVNKTDSAIRITHMPSGIIVACQTQRSQHQNRATAMTMLKSRLYDVERAKIDAARDAHNSKKMENAWGSQIRSYVLAPYRLVKDHRTDYESFQPDAVLDGELEDFVEAFLLKQNS